MMKQIKKILFLAGIASIFIFNSCESVKGYHKMYLNDSEMVLGERKTERLESSFLIYREGASGANGGKTGGGCGCN